MHSMLIYLHTFWCLISYFRKTISPCNQKQCERTGKRQTDAGESHSLYSFFKTQSFSCCCCCCLPYPVFAPVHKPASVLIMCRIKPCAFVFITQHAASSFNIDTHLLLSQSEAAQDSANDTDISECVCRAYTPDLGSARAIVTHGYTGNNHFYVI